MAEDKKKMTGPRLGDKKNFFVKNKMFTIFGILALVIVFIAVFAPIVSGGIDPNEGNINDAILPPGNGHLFGTDKMGRDIYARVIYGSRVSLVAAFSVVLLSFVIGIVLGILAGYFRGAVDTIIMRIADMMLAFPGLVLAMAVAGIMGASIRNAIFAIALVTWPKYA